MKRSMGIGVCDRWMRYSCLSTSLKESMKE